jgi:superfamily II DNA/RNA helicase
MTDAAIIPPPAPAELSDLPALNVRQDAGRGSGSGWAELLSGDWLRFVEAMAPGSTPRAVQRKALEAGLLAHRRNLMVAAPTNSGKSLVGTLVLLEALRQGKRAVLIEPLRALANEQADNLRRMLAGCADLLGAKASVRVTTGDYRLQSEEYADPAPGAELIVCTPERLDAILRNPDNQAWIESIGAVVLDEAHLIGNPRRGPTQELLLTSLLLQPAPPRLVLLSATLGDLERARTWLKPCDLVQVSERYPPLRKEVVAPAADETADAVVCRWLCDVLAAPENQALVFVYRTTSAEKLARELTTTLGPLAGPEGAVAYHGKLSSGQRETIRAAFLGGRSRVVVTTTALAMGVNLPATHVVVRDLTYHGAQSPGVSELLQMMGRAGRGDREGHAVAVCTASDDWTTAELQQALDEERLPAFRSAFALERPGSEPALSPAAPVVASLLSRAGEDGRSQQHLEQFLAHSLGGTHLVGQVGAALQWLGRRTLCYAEAGTYHLTLLGRRAVRSMLPLPLAAGFAQLLRDLMSVDDTDQLLGNWQELDHLLVLHLLHDGSPSLRTFSKALAEQVTGWCQGTPRKAPMLFNRWIDGEQGYSKAAEVLASLGLAAPNGKRDRAEWARRQGYQATFHAIALNERGQGRSADQLARQFKVKGLDGVEERWRDDMLWLLAGVASLLDIRTFYFHLREECEADPDRIKRVKRLLRRMRHQAYDLQETLKYCSPLGPALRDMRRFVGGVGVQTIRTLEDNGISGLSALQPLDVDALSKVGVRRDIAKRIRQYVLRRSR